MRGFKYSAEFETVLGAFIQLGKSGMLRRFEAMTMDKGGGVHPQLSNLVRSLPSQSGRLRGLFRSLPLPRWSGHTRAGSWIRP